MRHLKAHRKPKGRTGVILLSWSVLAFVLLVGALLGWPGKKAIIWTSSCTCEATLLKVTGHGSGCGQRNAIGLAHFLTVLLMDEKNRQTV